MKRGIPILSLLFCATFFWGCETTSHRYGDLPQISGWVDATVHASPGAFGTYTAVRLGADGTVTDDLPDVFATNLHLHLGRMGYQPASSVEDADLLVRVNYGELPATLEEVVVRTPPRVRQPVEFEQRTELAGIYTGEDGGPMLRTVESERPGPESAGRRSEAGNVVEQVPVFHFFMDLDVLDQKKLRGGDDPEEAARVWTVQVQTSSLNAGLVKHLPIMLKMAEPYFGTTTDEPVSVEQ